jgi:methyl-accepting chemotaxis protein
MNWFRNLKIRIKLISCFIILALVTGLVGFIGINSMNSLNENGDHLYNNYAVPALDLARVETYLQNIRANHLLAVYERKPETMQSRINEIEKYVELDTKLLVKYEKTIIKSKDRELFNKLNENLSNYRMERERNISLIKEQKYELALQELSKVSNARNKVEESLKDLIDYNTKQATSQVKLNDQNFYSKTTLMIIVIITGVVLAILLGLLVANIISRPINSLVEVADKISDGDLNIDIDINSKDEVGILANAFKKMTEKFNDVMLNINSSSEQVSSGAKQVSDSSLALSEGATEQASSIEQLSVSIEEISSQTNNNAKNAVQANELAEVAKQDAILGNTRMREMLRAMNEINESSSNISKIIKVIDEIAFQTNILALNAAVEAARAGQHGKGFAVVAEEVRNLAARSANAAKETTIMIEGSIKKVEDGTKIANETAQALDKIVDRVTKAANLVNDIAVASNEQATGITQINQGISQVSEVVQTNSATAEQSAAASEELSSQAEILREMVRKFKLKRGLGIHQLNTSDELNPEVNKIIERMSDKTKRRVKKNQINLSDEDFGKY